MDYLANISARWTLTPLLVGLLLVISTAGCYTQLGTMDDLRADRSGDYASEEQQVEERAEEPRQAERANFQRDEVAQMYDLYHARAHGDISYLAYKWQLQDYSFYRFNQFRPHSYLYMDPFYYGDYLAMSPTRFRLMMYGHGPTRYQMMALRGFGPRYGFHHSFSFGIHHHHYYGPFYGTHYRYRYAHGPSWGYHHSPYRYRTVHHRPTRYAIQRGSTYGAASSTIGSGRIGTEARTTRSGQQGRVGTPGRVVDGEFVPRTIEANSEGRVGSTGRVAQSGERQGESTVRNRVPERIEVPRTVTRSGATSPRTQTQRGSRTSTDRGSRTTRDRGSTTSRDRGSRTSSDRGSRTSRGNSSSGNSRAGSRGGSSTSNDRGNNSSSSGSRGSSSRGGGN